MCCAAKVLRKPNPRPMFPNPPGLLRLEPHAEGLRERIWWGAGSNATAEWAAKLGMNLQSSTLNDDETGEPSHVQQAGRSANSARPGRRPDTRACRGCRSAAASSRWSTIATAPISAATARARTRSASSTTTRRAIFGRSYAAEPDVLVKELEKDEAIAEADTLLLTVPNQLGVDYNAHVIEAILNHVAPALGWR